MRVDIFLNSFCGYKSLSFHLRCCIQHKFFSLVTKKLNVFLFLSCVSGGSKKEFAVFSAVDLVAHNISSGHHQQIQWYKNKKKQPIYTSYSMV